MNLNLFKILIILVFLIDHLKIQSQSRYYSQSDSVIGKVKSVELITQGCREKSFWKAIQKFDSTGRIIKEDHYYKDVHRSFFELYYNSKGNDSKIIQIEVLDIKHPEKRDSTIIHKKLNDDKQIVEYFEISKEKHFTGKIKKYDFKYDSVCRLKSYKTINGSVSLDLNFHNERNGMFKKIVIEFDNISNEIRKNNKHSDYKISSYNLNFFDHKGRLAKKIIIDSAKIVKKVFNYKYNKKGNLTFEKSYMYIGENRMDLKYFLNNPSFEYKLGKVDYDNKWRYIYDSKGNWIRSDQKCKFLYKPFQIRKITYE